jgi:hypothetical protein
MTMIKKHKSITTTIIMMVNHVIMIIHKIMCPKKPFVTIALKSDATMYARVAVERNLKNVVAIRKISKKEY